MRAIHPSSKPQNKTPGELASVGRCLLAGLTFYRRAFHQRA
jgi:hypothetical protein